MTVTVPPAKNSGRGARAFCKLQRVIRQEGARQQPSVDAPQVGRVAGSEGAIVVVVSGSESRSSPSSS
eukprot:5100180-Prymnesium_polylepis.1